MSTGHNTIGVSHIMVGNDLLGGGLPSLIALF